MSFLNGWRLDFKYLPAYVAFKGTFEEQLDAKFMDYMLADDRWRSDLRPLLAKIRNRLNPSGVNLIKHHQPKNVGRFYADEDQSVINLPRIMKHTLFKWCGWIDFDLMKSHPSICVEVGKKTKHRFLAMEDYINNFAEVVQRNLDYYSMAECPLDEDDIKDFFNASLNGGTFIGWINRIEKSDHNPKALRTKIISPDFKAYLDNCEEVANCIMTNNPELIEKIKGNKPTQREIQNATVSYWCGAIENDIIHTAYKYLVSQGIIKDRCCSPEYDGICFKPIKEHNWEELAIDINNQIQTKTGLSVRGKFKGYTKVCQDIIDSYSKMTTEPKEAILETENYENAECYTDFKREFEKTHCKIIDKSNFYKIKRDSCGVLTEIKIFTKEELKTSYEHLTYAKGKAVGKYVNDWLEDRTIRKYQDVNIIPPPLVCPANIFNLWSPFRIEQIYDQIEYPELQSEMEVVETKMKRILNHIHILCNEEKEISDYLISWIGQALKYPAIKTTCPTLISKEGAGKGTLIKCIKRLMGESKVLETADPKQFVWGSFNELMINAYFVSLNEMQMKDAVEAEGKIKMLIKDDDMMINPKGKGHIKAKSHHRFMGSSNNEVPVKSDKDDRRNMVQRCSDKLLIKNSDGSTNEENRKYFRELNDYIMDDQVIKCLYDYLTNLPNLDTFHTLQPPTTEYQKLIQTGNVNPIEEWLVQFTRDNWYVKEVKITAKDMTSRFGEWRDAHNLKFSCDSAKLSRAIGIAMLNFPKDSRTIVHSGKANYTIFNIDLMKTHLKLVEGPQELVVQSNEVGLDIDDDGFTEE